MRDSNQVIYMICESIELVGVGSQLDRFFSEKQRKLIMVNCRIQYPCVEKIIFSQLRLRFSKFHQTT